jgi:hypothetical protein
MPFPLYYVLNQSRWLEGVGRVKWPMECTRSGYNLTTRASAERLDVSFGKFAA